MAKFSMKQGGKEVGSAQVYAPPHTMTGKKTTAVENPGKPSEMSSLDTMNLGVGFITNTKNKGPKTDGIKTRGNGAATKGVMARGPMA
jgi:hypothetical protein